MEFARQLRPARVHQPADADRSPVNSRALPKSASSRTRTTWPRRLFVHRSNRWGAVGLTNGVVGGDRFVRERDCLDRGLALTALEDGGSAVLQAGTSRAGPLARRIEGCLQPPGNTPQPPSTNVVPAHDQHPHETALNGLAFIAPGQEPPRPYPRLRHAKRLPSPARPAVENGDRSSAGEGRGWGDSR